MTARKLIAALLIILLLAACEPIDALKRRITSLEFQVEMEVNATGEFHVSLGVTNSAKWPFPGDTAFAGIMEVRDETGKLIARTYVPSLRQLGPNKCTFPESWRAHLLPGRYYLTWGAPNYGWTATEFVLAETDGRLHLQESPEVQEVPQTPAARGDRGATHVLIQMATADLISRLGLRPDEVAVKSFESTIFLDTSLGVPEKDRVYSQTLTPGYVIKLVAQGQIHRYHGAGEYIVYAGEGNKTTRRVGSPQAIQSTPPRPVPTVDFMTVIPDSAHVLAHETAELDHDAKPEQVVLAAYGGSPERLGYDRLELFVIEPDRPDYAVAWQNTLTGDRLEQLLVQDINQDGQEEVLVITGMGAEGQTLHLLAWQEEAYDLLRPHGGHFDGQESFGENSVRLEDIDGDGVIEILAGHGPAASLTEVYAWDGSTYIYIHTLQEGT